MADDLTVSGANQLAALTRRLKAAGEGGLRRDMLRGLREGAKPLVGVAREAARDRLPKQGGLNEVVAASRFAVRTRTSGRNPGVRVVALSPHHLAAMNKGHVRHPTFGHEPWVTQRIYPGWWSEPLKAQAPDARAVLVEVLHETARRVEHG